MMHIPDQVWEKSEEWKRITGCDRPLWSDFDTAHSVTNWSRADWTQAVSFVRHYQACPNGDKEAVSKGQTPPSALHSCKWIHLYL